MHEENEAKDDHGGTYFKDEGSHAARGRATVHTAGVERGARTRMSHAHDDPNLIFLLICTEK
jgi:hypothetical protein